jgi:conjugative transfer region lipoprotein (TIGR03751 family)
MSGNVVPEKGPTMENVYDDQQAEYKRRNVISNEIVSSRVNSNVFHKLSNPELKMLVYPHFSNKDDTPIPAYYTVFNAYEKDHYTLPNEEGRIQL